jgi:hypothetical protein
MKLILFLSSFFLFISCTQKAKVLENEDVFIENPLIGKWKLQFFQKNEENKKETNLKEQTTHQILSIMEGGYFMIYDTFIDHKFNDKGFNRIAQRSKGQWEFDNNKKLILHHIFDDTTYIEELFITTLNKNTLVTKGKEKNANIYKTYQGY